MAPLEGQYLDDVKVVVNGQEHTLHIWRNPKTGNLTAFDNMELPAVNRFFYDAYTGDRVLVADTFTGLPK